jgi:hypothetical protein
VIIMTDDHCKNCGAFARYGDYCSKQCRQKWYIKHGEKDNSQSSMDVYFK